MLALACTRLSPPNTTTLPALWIAPAVKVVLASRSSAAWPTLTCPLEVLSQLPDSSANTPALTLSVPRLSRPRT